MKLYEALEQAKFDKRLLDWNLNNGNLNAKDYKKHLDSLPDLANSAEKLDFENHFENGAEQ